jgi:hypothetical protein
MKGTQIRPFSSLETKTQLGRIVIEIHGLPILAEPIISTLLSLS